MYRKLCHDCGKRSYSVSRSGHWYCPSCGADLAAQPAACPSVGELRIIPLRAGTVTDPVLYN